MSYLWWILRLPGREGDELLLSSRQPVSAGEEGQVGEGFFETLRCVSALQVDLYLCFTSSNGFVSIVVLWFVSRKPQSQVGVTTLASGTLYRKGGGPQIYPTLCLI